VLAVLASLLLLNCDDDNDDDNDDDTKACVEQVRDHTGRDNVGGGCGGMVVVVEPPRTAADNAVVNNDTDWIHTTNDTNEMMVMIGCIVGFF
jgi:hypothetical protein